MTVNPSILFAADRINVDGPWEGAPAQKQDANPPENANMFRAQVVIFENDGAVVYALQEDGTVIPVNSVSTGLNLAWWRRALRRFARLLQRI